MPSGTEGFATYEIWPLALELRILSALLGTVEATHFCVCAQLPFASVGVMKELCGLGLRNSTGSGSCSGGGSKPDRPTYLLCQVS